VPQIKNVGRIVVPVADLDAATEFDTSKLGFNLVADVPFGDDERWVEVALQRPRRHPVDDRREPVGGAEGASQRALGDG
jgi:catechol 2,3-dioxygenase-like lactoylglutathione lyase family enzyme